jgi:hypothetical protein
MISRRPVNSIVRLYLLPFLILLKVVVEEQSRMFGHAAGWSLVVFVQTGFSIACGWIPVLK